jgi:hypothetical protein
MSEKLSRRDFLKVSVLGMGATFLAACGRALKITAPPPATPTPTSTNTPQPTATDTPTSTPTDTPTPTPIPCFKLLTPETGAKLPAIGTVTFSWESMPGATRYQLQFTLPSGTVISFDVEGISSTRYLESFLTAGIYQWLVIAFDINNAEICSAESFLFTKEQTPAPNNDGGGDKGPQSSAGAGSSGAFSSGTNL